MIFHTLYHPLTSRPFLSGAAYTEYQPCLALQPYIRCYWESNGTIDPGNTEKEVLVNPDTCMDIIVRINHTKQCISGFLCGMQDQPFLSVERNDGDLVSCFAIRFSFWAAGVFLKLNLCEASNQKIELRNLGREWEELFAPFMEWTDSSRRIARVESFLLNKRNEMAVNSNLYQSIMPILQKGGNLSAKDICESACVSQRQMERLFLQKVGLPMKRIAGLVRYQNVWRDRLYQQEFRIQDAVYEYGYTDQSHLLKDFKRFHGTTMQEAVQIASCNQQSCRISTIQEMQPLV